MNNIKILALSLITIIFVACGGGSSEDSTSSTDLETVSGTALASYVRDGVVFLDCNKNSLKDDNELYSTTNSDGSFSISSSDICSDYNIVVLGGINTATNLPIPYPTIAPKDSKYISPISTILSKIEDKDSFVQKLGFDSIDEIDFDYNKESNTTVNNLKGVKALFEAILYSTSSVIDINENILDSIVNNFANTLKDNTLDDIDQFIVDFIDTISKDTNLNNNTQLLNDINTTLYNVKDDIEQLVNDGDLKSYENSTQDIYKDKIVLHPPVLPVVENIPNL